jgi:hypothetical protein
MINTLQLIVHLPLFSINFPPNVIAFFKALINIVTFDFYNLNPKLEALFTLPSDSSYTAFNDRFDFMGYSTTNSLYNIGLPVFYLMIYMVMGILYGILSGILKCTEKIFIEDENGRDEKQDNIIVRGIKKISNYLSGCLFWAPLVRFIIELALEGVLCCIINLLAIPDVEDWNYG